MHWLVSLYILDQNLYPPHSGGTAVGLAVTRHRPTPNPRARAAIDGNARRSQTSLPAPLRGTIAPSNSAANRSLTTPSSTWYPQRSSIRREVDVGVCPAVGSNAGCNTHPRASLKDVITEATKGR